MKTDTLRANGTRPLTLGCFGNAASVVFTLLAAGLLVAPLVGVLWVMGRLIRRWV